MIAAVQIVREGVNQDALKLAEEMLARIRSGETISIGLVEVLRGRTVITAASKGEAYHLLNSGAARLAATLAMED